MMGWYGNGMSGWAMAIMAVGNVLFWGLVVAGVVVTVRYLGRGGQRGPADERPSPQRLLGERYARGEIDEEEYTRRLQVLRTGPSS